MMIVAITLPLVVLGTRTWNPYRWSMYINAMRDTAAIEFYGGVVDPDGKPLSGAVVRITVVKPNWAFILGTRRRFADAHYELSTNEDGRFELTGKTGVVLQVTAITLSGYEFKPQITGGGNWATSFYFAGGGVGRSGPHRPDPRNPVLFTMVPRTTKGPN